MNQKCNIYALFSLDEPEHIRYVGQTKNSVERRISQHINDAKKNRKLEVSKWISSVNYKIGYRILEKQAEYNIAEIKWIKTLKRLGHSLTNLTSGGKGTVNLVFTKEHRRKLSISAKNRKPMSAETRKKISDKCKGYKHTDEARIKIALAGIGRKFSKDSLRIKGINISKALKGRRLSETHKMNISIGLRKNEKI